MEYNPIETKLKNDWISNMPDSILCNILYYLPTKDAVATSILSKRWKNLFPFVIVTPIKVVLDDSMLLHPEKYEKDYISKSFTDFVGKLLNKTLCDVMCVHEMVLKCHHKYEDAKIVSWVSASLLLKARHLVLDLSLNNSKTLFDRLKGYTALTSLELGKYFDLYLPNNFTLPNVQCIHLQNLAFHGQGKKSINELIAGCPKLEKLCFTRCNLRRLGVLNIQSSLLKNFTTEDSWKDSSCDLVLEAPNLEVLSYCDSSARSYTLSNFKSLLAAHIDVEDNGVAQLVYDCYHINKLYLAACSIEALQCSPTRLPLFLNLTWLSLGCLGFNGWILLARLLWSAPNLESLMFEEGFKVNKYGIGYAKFKSLVQNLPFCLELHLKKIEFRVFKGEEEEIQLIEYFVKNGKVLQTIKIHCLPFENSRIVIKLLKLHRHSKTCRFLLEKI